MTKINQHAAEGTKAIHYIVVVHGIGKQRKNETILPVIGQFAAARHNDPEQKRYLTLGGLTSQSRENLWIEYQNIPDSADPLLKKPWVPILVNDSQAKNLRFVDFCWSEVTRKSHEKVGEPTNVWTESLINRLKLRVSLESEKENKRGKPTQWIVDMMETLQEGVLFVEKVMAFRLPHITKEIFGEFLGDVEMYGDFPHTRGRAVRLFHETMANVHAAHLSEFPDKDVIPHYTIIAHSLGTVLTMDAISYAYANKKSRQSTAKTANTKSIVHFPGYDNSLFPGETPQSDNNEINLKKIPEVHWIKYLHSYITLGSPIDKYLALWPENYRHFNHTEWMDKAFVSERNQNKIKHFNYSDEQDPVGHELNILKSTLVWNELAEIPEDIVFNRYIYPGKAHVDYWEDNQLFSRILDLNIDNCEQFMVETEQQKMEDGGNEKQKIKWFKECVYIKALIISFIVIPFSGWFIASYSLNTVVASFLKNGIKEFPVIAFIIFLFTLFLTHILMKLLIEWQIVLGVSRKRDHTPEEKDKRAKIKGILEKTIIWSPFIWGFLFLAILFFGIDAYLPKFILPLLNPLTVGLLLAFVVSFNILLINRKMHTKWKKNSIETDFKEYLKPLQK